MRAIRFAVLSDTHGDESIQEGIFQRYAEKVDFWFHCGDGELPPEWILSRYAGVRGNCDAFAGLPLTRDIAFPFGRVHLEHGHRSGGVSPEFVASCRCAYFFSGHTHRKLAFHHPFGTWQFNPGSLVKPRDGARGSFLLLEVDEASGKLLSYRFALVDPKTGEEVEGGEEKRFA